jgi:lipoprotein-releasing system permease protein
LRYEFFIGSRYLRSKRKQTFISVISLISVGSVALGVAALLVVTSVMTGFTKEMTEKIVGTHANLVILKEGAAFDDYRKVSDEIKDVPGVVASTPFIQTQVMLSGSEGAISGAVLRGIDQKTAPAVIALTKTLVAGGLDQLDAQGDLPPGIILGTELAKTLGVAAGDTVIMLSPVGGEITPFGMMPKMRRFRVAGLFDAGMYEYNSSFAYISLPAAQNFLEMGDSVSGIEVRLDDIYRAREVSRLITAKLSLPFFAVNWMDMNRNLFAMLALQKVTLFIILTLIVCVAAFNIAATLIMLVMEKKKDIAILRTMGVTRGGIMRIFVMEGMTIGVVGVIVGLLAGWGMCWLLSHYRIVELDPKIYYFTTFPVDVSAADVLIVSAASLVICLVCTLYPAWQASRMDPVEAIRYE